MRVVGLLFLLLIGWGCGLVGPSCLGQQKRGTVASIEGEVPAGQVVSHLVAYGTEGSQNDAEVSWPGQSAADGPRIAVYATRADCVDFAPPPAASGGACALLGSAGWFDGHVATSLTVTHGRGNPEILGSPPQFRLWVVGDPARTTTYRIAISWFRGPDC
jgi:hypothetical protein